MAIGDINLHIGERIKQGRELRDMTLEALGAALGISYQQVYKYEKAANRVATWRLIKIGITLQLPLAYFIGEIEGLPDSTHSLPGISGADLRLAEDFNRLEPRFQKAVRGIIVVLGAEMPG